jgi:hypothetical protein
MQTPSRTGNSLHPIPRSTYRLSILVLILLLSPTAADFPPGEDLCLDRWRCAFEHVNASTGQTWRWDLSTLCRPLGGSKNGTYVYSGPGTTGQDFAFNVCGNSSMICSDYVNEKPMYESVGVATQFFQTGRGTRSNAGTSCLREDNATACPDYTFGGTTCCSTRRCEVVAVESFRFDVVDQANPASGGVTLMHDGYPDSDNDDNDCPFQDTGLRRLRRFILNLQCDPNGKIDDLTVTNYDESSQYCIFRLTATTKAACGVLDGGGGGGGGNAAADGNVVGPGAVGPTGQFGFTVLGALLAIGVQGAIAAYRANKRGELLDVVNRLGVKQKGSPTKGERSPLRLTAMSGGGGV